MEMNYRENVNKRLFVPRPTVAILLFFVFGLVAWFFWYRYIVWIYLFLFLLTALLFFVKVFDKKLFICCLLALILSFEGALYLYVFDKKNYLEKGVYQGIARVESVSTNGQIILSDVQLGDKELSGNIVVSNINAKTGDLIAFTGELETFSLSDRYELHRIARGIYYEMKVDEYSHLDTSYQSLRNRIVYFIKDGFIRSAGGDSADYLMSIMFGESDYLVQDVKSDYTLIGVAHVFAVSGLHIGVLSAVLSFVCKKVFRLADKVIPFVLLPVFGFYAYLCNFSPSVLRASIMFLLSSVLLNFEICSDKPSVFCFTALVSLIAKPVWIGDMSFLLSYGAVLGAYLLYPMFKKPFYGLKKLKNVANAIALNCSITVSMIPLSCLFFSSVSVVAILGSFFIIPLTSALYVITVALMPLVVFSFITKPLAFVAKLLVSLSAIIADALAEVNADISIRVSEVGLMFWYSALLVVSDYCSLKNSRKIIAFSFLTCLAILV